MQIARCDFMYFLRSDVLQLRFISFISNIYTNQVLIHKLAYQYPSVYKSVIEIDR